VSSRRGRIALGLGAVVIVVALVTGFLAGVSEQRRLDRAERAETAQRGTLRETRTMTAKEEQTLRAAYVAAGVLRKQLVDGTADVSVTTNAVAVAKAALGNAQAVFNAQEGRRAIVDQCLSGVKRALDATRLRQTAAATAYLRDASPACQTALTPPGESAPVLAYDFADPFVMRSGADYYAFATNAAGGSVQEAHSRDLAHWDLVGNALANLPAWAVEGSVWAPAAIQRGGDTILYYTVRERKSGKQCITFAVGKSARGPFVDGSSKPMDCGFSGAIDPSPFVDASGAPYLLFKSERPAQIWSRPLAANGRSFAGPARLMLGASQRWEGGNVEAPSMLRAGGAYWLFYSGNDWNGAAYAEGVARCYGPTGPCAASRENPVLATAGTTAGPGGGEVFSDGSGGWRLAYHAYQAPLVRYPNSRLLHLGHIGFSGSGTPTVSP
jgi:Glycosyl hydrolases family 43